MGFLPLPPQHLSTPGTDGIRAAAGPTGFTYGSGPRRGAGDKVPGRPPSGTPRKNGRGRPPTTPRPSGRFPVNDPSAGSPTETLLRLLLPLGSPVRSASSDRRGPLDGGLDGPHLSTSPSHPSVVATGGVYKGQGLNQRGLVTRTYWEFLVDGGGRSPRSQSRAGWSGLPEPLERRVGHALARSVWRACGPGHLRASQTCYCSISRGSNFRLSL